MPHLYGTTLREVLRREIITYPMCSAVGQRPVRETEFVTNAIAVSIGNSFASIPQLPTNMGDVSHRFCAKERDHGHANTPDREDATQASQ